MEQIYNNKMSEFGYNQFVCDIFLNWEDIKDEILLPERKKGSGNGTVHVFLGAADEKLRNEFPDYYKAVSDGQDTSIGAIKVAHYFMKSNVLSMLGYVCEYDIKKDTEFSSTVVDILTNVDNSNVENGMLVTSSFLKLSIGSNKLRPYFKQFEDKGVFHKIIRPLLLPNSSYKIALYKNANNEYAAFWLIGFGDLDNYMANANSDYIKKPLAKLKESDKPLQQIFYGAPGTGKSHIIKETTKGEKVIRTTFHPDSDYSTFVGAYKPTTKEITMRDLSGKPVLERNENGAFVEVKEEKIIYEFVQQAFLQAYTNAWKQYTEAQLGETPKAQYLVIEELNRGTCAQIFGDLFQLLDRNDCGFSDYPIKADNDMKKQLVKAFAKLDIPQCDSINALYDEENIVNQVLCGEVLLLPNNLYIWATMNTSDQSLFPIDSAFKRRWDWKYMPIHNAGKNWRIAVNGVEYDWWKFLEKVNEYIGSTTNSEDKKLGYFFCKPKNEIVNAETFVGKVIFYLWNDVFKDYGFEGTLFECEEGTLTFDKFYGADAKTIKEKNVEQFLKNLGLEPLSEVTQTNIVDKEGYEVDGEYYVQLPGKPRFTSSKSTDVVKYTIKALGANRVATALTEAGKMFNRKGCPVISTETHDDIISQEAYHYEEVGDGYYFLCGIDNLNAVMSYIRDIVEPNMEFDVKNW